VNSDESRMQPARAGEEAQLAISQPDQIAYCTELNNWLASWSIPVMSIIAYG
jgi:hypothetical protein